MSEKTPNPPKRIKTTKPRFRLLKHVAEDEGFPYSTLRTAVYKGELAVVKIGRVDSQRQAWYVNTTEFQQWIEQRTVRHA